MNVAAAQNHSLVQIDAFSSWRCDLLEIAFWC